jgi:hypothetical protein
MNRLNHRLSKMEATTKHFPHKVVLILPNMSDEEAAAEHGLTVADLDRDDVQVIRVIAAEPKPYQKPSNA